MHGTIPPVMSWSRKPASPPVVALVLGSGGARGWAHVGVLRALADLKFAPDLVVGTSIGAVAAAIHASGALAAAERLAEQMDWRRAAKLFFEIGLPKSGLLEGRRVMELLRELIPEPQIDNLPIPYAAVATDLRSQREIVLTKGDLYAAMRASISIPGIFTPVSYLNHWLVDGGLVNPLPVSVARSMGATRVVAVDINLREGVAGHAKSRSSRPIALGDAEPLPSWLRDEDRPDADEDAGGESPLRGFLEGLLGIHGSARRNAPPALLEVITRSLRAGENAITRERLLREPPELLIQPSVGHLSTLDFHCAAAAIQAGRDAVMENADALAGLRA